MGRVVDIDPQANVILSSGTPEDPTLERFRDYGFKAVVTKPFRMEELLDVLQKTISGRG